MIIKDPKLKDHLKIFFHCLWNFHCPMDISSDGKTTHIGCWDCNQEDELRELKCQE